MSDSKKGYVRKQYIVDKEMQTYHLKVWLLSSVVIIATIACFFYFFKIQPATAKDPVITYNLYVVLMGTAAFIILYSVLMGLQAMLHSHRVAGAEYNLKNSIFKYLNKDFGHRVVLRKGDYLQSLANSINDLAAHLQEDREAFTGLLEKLEGLPNLSSEAKEITSSMRELIGVSEKEQKEEKSSEEIKQESSQSPTSEEKKG